MESASRDLYRHEVERLARRGALDEREVAAATVRLAGEAGRRAAPGHVGYYLIDAGRPALERALRYRPRLDVRWRRAVLARPLLCYLGLLVLLLAP